MLSKTAHFIIMKYLLIVLLVILNNCAIISSSFEHGLRQQPNIDAINTCWTGSLATVYEFARNDLFNSYMQPCKIANSYLNIDNVDCCARPEMCEGAIRNDHMYLFVRKYVDPRAKLLIYEDMQTYKYNDFKNLINQGVLLINLDGHSVVLYGWYDYSQELVYIDPLYKKKKIISINELKEKMYIAIFIRKVK